jgi:hypothetical protein
VTATTTATTTTTLGGVFVPDPDKPDQNHFLVCHKGKTKSVDAAGVLDHLAHGDTPGECL